MLFVDTALAVAIDRDAERSRSLGARKVTELWDQVQRNKDRLAELFSPNFDIVNNDEFGPPPKEIASALNNFVAEPVQNPLGQAWINHELEQRSK